MTDTITSPLRVLGIFAHPDDSEFTCGGSAALWAEQRAACAVLGVQDVIFLGYPDGTLQPTLELRRDLTRIIRQLKPDRVVCGDPAAVLYGDSYINHPDHRAAAEAAIYAIFPSAVTRPIFPELLAEGYEPHQVKEVYISGTEKS